MAGKKKGTAKAPQKRERTLRSFYATDEEWALINRAAEADHRDASTYARLIVLERAKRDLGEE